MRMGKISKQENQQGIISTLAIMWRNHDNVQTITVSGTKKTWRCWNGWKCME